MSLTEIGMLNFAFTFYVVSVILQTPKPSIIYGGTKHPVKCLSKTPLEQRSRKAIRPQSI